MYFYIVLFSFYETENYSPLTTQPLRKTDGTA